MNCRPYPCQVCGDRFGSHQSLREHYERAHPGMEGQLNYAPQSDEDRQKRDELKMWVAYALGVQSGQIQPPSKGPSLVTASQDGPINNLPPMAAPRVLNRQPAPVAPAPDTAQRPAIPEANTVNPPAPQPVESGDVVACAALECHEPIPATYLKQCQHVLHNHTDQSEANFTAMLQQCFPEAREFHNMTCIDCGMVLTGRKASQEQSEHVESHHLSELGVRLHCPIASCRDADVNQQTRVDLVRHIKKYHGGVISMGRHDREAKKAYHRMKKEAEQMLVRVTRRFFPFTPADVPVIRRPNDGGGEPAAKRVHFAEEDEVLEYEPDDYEGYDDGVVGEGNMEEDDDDSAGDDDEATGNDNAAGGGGDEEEEDEDENMLLFLGPL